MLLLKFCTNGIVLNVMANCHRTGIVPSLQLLLRLALALAVKQVFSAAIKRIALFSPPIYVLRHVPGHSHDSATLLKTCII